MSVSIRVPQAVNIWYFSTHTIRILAEDNGGIMYIEAGIWGVF